MDGTSTASGNWRLDGSTLTVRIPMTVRRQGGRKRIVAPDQAESWAPAPQTPNQPLVRALARAHRWRRLLEDGTYATIAELAQAEKITNSYVSRILQLSLLAPDIVEALLDGKVDPGLTLGSLSSLPLLWDEQRAQLTIHKT